MLFGRLVVLVIWWIGLGTNVHSVPNGACKHLSSTSIQSFLASTCANVVDYAYFLPSGVEESTLNTLAASKLSDSRFTVLPSSCQLSLKKMVCSSVYLKCQNNINFQDSSTLNYNIYSDLGLRVGLPFQRPCANVCSQVSSKCLGLLALFSATPNCSAVNDYSFGSIATRPRQYDIGNDPSICNAMSYSKVPVAGTMEPYLFQRTGACAGITSRLWVPPAPQVSVALAPMSSAFYLQMLLNYNLLAMFSSVPAHILDNYPSCSFAMRSLFCARTFMMPRRRYLTESMSSSMQQALGSKGVNITALRLTHVYLPSYPSHSLCAKYLVSCPAELVSLPTFAVNCSGVNSARLRLFPTANQSVFSFSVPTGPSTIAKLSFSTPPNTLSSALDVGKMPSNTALGACQPSLASLPNAQDLICGDAVDYAYYQPAGMTLDTMNNIAYKTLNNSTKIWAFDESCLVSMKKLVCASIYLKCVDNVELNDTSTWSTAIYGEVGYPFPLPFQRPCLSLCRTAQDSCGHGFMRLLGLGPDCNERYDYSNGNLAGSASDPLNIPSRYDSSNNQQQCNAMPVNFRLGTAAEEYHFKSTGVCAGIVDNVYIPPGTILGSKLGMFNPPNVLQSKIEATLESRRAGIKPFLTPGCHFALRKYFCSLVYAHPEHVQLEDAFANAGISSASLRAMFLGKGFTDGQIALLLGSSLVLPAYASTSVCMDYAIQCSTLLLVQSESATVNIQPNCSLTNNIGLKQFTDSPQTIIRLSVPLASPGGGTLSLNLQTKPFAFHNSSDSGYQPVCPPQFVIPDEVGNPLTLWVQGSACAVPCIGSAALKPDQHNQQRELSVTSSSVGLVLVVILLLTWYLDSGRRAKNRNAEVLVTIFALSSMLITITILVTSVEPAEEIFCHSNTVPITYKDGLTMCTFQSAVLAYCGLVNNLSWFMLAVDLFLKITLRILKPKRFLTIALPIIFILPAVSLTALLVGQGEGYSMNTNRCFYASLNALQYSQHADLRNDQDIAFFHIPMSIFTGTGAILMLSVLWSSIAAMRKNMEDFWVMVNLLKTPFAFVVLGCFCWFSVISYRFYYFRTILFVRKHFRAWIRCVFQQFDGSNSYTDVCGTRPPHMYSFDPAQWQFVCLCGQSMFMASIYLSSVYATIAYNLYNETYHATVSIARRLSVVVQRSSFARITPQVAEQNGGVIPTGPQASGEGISNPDKPIGYVDSRFFQQPQGPPNLISGYDPDDYETLNAAVRPRMQSGFTVSGSFSSKLPIAATPEPVVVAGNNYRPHKDELMDRIDISSKVKMKPAQGSSPLVSARAAVVVPNPAAQAMSKFELGMVSEIGPRDSSTSQRTERGHEHSIRDHEQDAEIARDLLDSGPRLSMFRSAKGRYQPLDANNNDQVEYAGGSQNVDCVVEDFV